MPLPVTPGRSGDALGASGRLHVAADENPGQRSLTWWGTCWGRSPPPPRIALGGTQGTMRNPSELASSTPIFTQEAVQRVKGMQQGPAWLG